MQRTNRKLTGERRTVAVSIDRSMTKRRDRTMVVAGFGSLLFATSLKPDVVAAGPLMQATHGIRQRFRSFGPVLTLTLKNPFRSESLDDLLFSGDDVDEESELTSYQSSYNDGRITSLSSLCPSLYYSVQSTPGVPPLPRFLPSLKSVGAALRYDYGFDQDPYYGSDSVSSLAVPSLLETNFQFEVPAPMSNEIMPGNRQSSEDVRSAVDVSVCPTFDMDNERAVIVAKVSGKKGGGSSYVMARFASNRSRFLDGLQASYKAVVPKLLHGSGLSSLTITPSIDYAGGPTCMIRGDASSGRSAVLVNWRPHDPVVKIAYALNDRSTLAPEVSLRNGHLRYDWSVRFASGSVVSARVDPLRSVDVTWSDSSQGNGKWVADFRLPLEQSTSGPLAVDFRIRRQFSF